MIQCLLRENGAWMKKYFTVIIDLAKNTARKCEEEGLHKDAVVLG